MDGKGVSGENRERCEAARGIVKGGVALVLTATLAAPWPVASIAEAAEAAGGSGASVAASSGDGAASASAETVATGAATAAAGTVDLSALWGAQGCTITQGGTYVLTADVVDAGTLVVAVPAGETATIDFAGHTVACARTTTVGIDASKSTGGVVIQNSQPTYASGAEQAPANMNACLTLDAHDAATDVAGILCNPAQRAAGTAAPTLSVQNVGVRVSSSTTTGGASRIDVAGICLGAIGEEGYEDPDYVAVEASLSGCAVQVNATTCVGTACAVFAESRGVQILDGFAASAQGAGSVAELASAYDASFTFGEGFSCLNTLRVNAAGNAAGAVAAYVGAGLDAANAAAVVLEDATDSGMTCSLSNDGSCYVFAQVAGTEDALSVAEEPESSVSEGAGETEAASGAEAAQDATASLLASEETTVQLVHEGAQTAYATFDEAFAAASSGDTLVLLADADDLALDRSDLAGEVSIDLAGHTVRSLSVSADMRADVKITSSVDGGAVRETSGAVGYAISHAGSGTLSVEGIGIEAVSSSVQVNAVSVSGSGALTLADCAVSAVSQRNAARGIFQSSSSTAAISVSGGSISASTSAVGVAAYGVLSSSGKNGASISLQGCAMSVLGTTATTRGIDAKCAVSATDSSIGVNAATGTNSVCGIRVTKAGAAVSLSGISISVSASEVSDGASCWCVTTGGSDTTNSTVIALDGACSFSSCTDTDIDFYTGEDSEGKTNLMQVGSSFSTTSGAVKVDSREAVDGVFASILGASSSVATLFEPTANSAYAGWEAASSLGEIPLCLEWQHENVACNAATGKSYASISEAIAEAETGQTIQLLSNATTLSSLVVSQENLTIDLAGYALAIDDGSKASSSKGALVYTGSGVLTLTGGSIDIAVGATPETTTSVGSGYKGVAVTGGGSMVVSSCSLDVAYAGTSTVKPSVTLYGVSVESGSLSLEASQLSVSAAQTDGAYGATEVIGIYAASSSATDAVSVDSNSSVTVNNNAAALSKGQVQFPGTEISGTNSEKNADLIELDVDPESELYAEIVEQFRISAQFDSQSDSAGYVYGTNMYYASSMETESGLVVWACSDPVDTADQGKLDSIVPTHIFVRSTYQVQQNAYAVTASSSATCSVDVEGALSASTDAGRAIGALQNDAATWSVDEARISVTCGSDSYFARTGSFDLADYIDLDESKLDMGSSTAVVYPESAKYYEVVATAPEAKKIAKLTDAVLPEKGSTTYEEIYAGMEEDVSVTFSNIRSASGEATSKTTVSVPYGSTLEEAGVDVPAPADYESGGLTYRFVGWRLSSNTTATYAYETAALGSQLSFDGNVSGVSSGAVELVACYVPVGEGQHLATFRVEYGVYAYAVNDGDTPSFAACVNQSGVEEPSLLSGETHNSYTATFAGWVKGSDETVYLEDGQTALSDPLPAATGDVAYTARFTRELDTMSLSFMYLRPVNGSYEYTGEVLSDIDWRSDAIDIANERVKVGDEIDLDGTTYTFLGWSTRRSDVEPLYTDTLPLGTSESAFENSVTYYGIYSSAVKRYTVCFYANGELHATASDVPATDTVYTAFHASDNPEDPASAVEGQVFKGWAFEDGATKKIYDSIVKIYEAPANDLTVSLYAVFGEEAAAEDPVVTFYDSDRTTIIDQLAVTSGSTVTASTGEDPKPTGENADLFEGWVDEAGNAFDPQSTTVSESLSVFAMYLETSTGTGEVSVVDGSSDTSTGSTGSTSSSTGIVTSGTVASASGGAVANVASSGAVANAALAAVETAANSSAAEGGDEAVDASEAVAEEASEEEADSEGVSNAVGVVGVLVALAGILGSLIWWFFGRRRKDDEDEEELDLGDEAMPADDAPGMTGGIRF